MSNSEISPDINSELLALFPQTKLTLKDRIPTSMLYFSAIMQTLKAIKDIKYSAEELREIMLALIAMIPDELRDESFKEEFKKTVIQTPQDIRPSFCGTKLSYEFCQKKGIPHTSHTITFDYMAMYHCIFNLLMRKNMLLQITPKQMDTAEYAKKDKQTYDEEEEEVESQQIEDNEL